MALSLPGSFKNDLHSKDTSLIPLVVIGDSSNSFSITSTSFYRDWILLSTNSYSIAGLNFKPLLLNIPSLKESIGIEKRNYKISNITLNISNYQYDGFEINNYQYKAARFSDIIGNNSLINKEVWVLWASPSITDVKLTGLNYGDAFRVYYGVIRRYDHDDEKVKLSIEDRSQASLHRDLPVDDVGTEAVPDKYKNKPTPIVMGTVKKSPCVVSTSTAFDEDLEQGGISTLKVDKDGSGSVAGDQLYVYDSAYTNIPKVPLYTFDFVIPAQQYNTDGNKIIIGQETFQQTSDTDPNILPVTQIIVFDKFTSPQKITAHRDYVGPMEGDFNMHNTTNSFIKTGSGKLAWCSGTLLREADDADWQSGDPETENSPYPTTPDSRTEHWCGGEDINCIHDDILGEDNYCCSEQSSLLPQGSHVGMKFDFPNYTPGDIVEDKEGSKLEAGLMVLNAWVYYYNLEFYQGSNVDIKFFIEAAGVFPYANVHTVNDTDATYDNRASLFSVITNLNNPVVIKSPVSSIDLKCSIDHTIGRRAIMGIDIEVYDLEYYHYALVDNYIELDFYSDVIGRISNPTAPQAIKSIMETELGVTGIDDEDTTYNAWKYAFTVNKKISSKKLLEGLSSASPYIPRFDNEGNFKINVIKKTYNASSLNDAGGNKIPNSTISEDSVINFSYSRTKIEDVKTAVELKWNWDYAIDDFTKNLSNTTHLEKILGITDVLAYGEDGNYNNSYYGFKEIAPGVPSHDESTLVLDGEQGKYIRDGGTARDFAEWKLLWHCNQHLKIKVKLSLGKGLNLEVGDIVEFETVLGGVKPYGINYAKGSASTERTINGQIAYAYFMITSTVRNLEWVEIETIMMHNLQACPSGEYDCNGVCGDISGSLIGNTDYPGDGTDEHPSGYGWDGCGVCGGSGQTIDPCGICDPPDGEYGETCNECNELANHEVFKAIYGIDSPDFGYCGDILCSRGCNPPSSEQLELILAGTEPYDGYCNLEDLGCGCGVAGPSGCDNACGSDLTIDECGVCGGGDMEGLSFCQDLNHPWPDSECCNNGYNQSECAAWNEFDIADPEQYGGNGFYWHEACSCDAFFDACGNCMGDLEAFETNVDECPTVFDFIVTILKPYPEGSVEQYEWNIGDEYEQNHVEDGYGVAVDGVPIHLGFYKYVFTPYNVYLDTGAGYPSLYEQRLWVGDRISLKINRVNYVNGIYTVWDIFDVKLTISFPWDDFEQPYFPPVGQFFDDWAGETIVPEETILDDVIEYVFDLSGYGEDVLDRKIFHFHPEGVLDPLSEQYSLPPFDGMLVNLQWNINYKRKLESESEDQATEHTKSILFSGTYGDCPQMGDLNGDGSWNVLDVTIMASCILNNDCWEEEYACAMDLYADGHISVLDLVSLAHCILMDTCEDNYGEA